MTAFSSSGSSTGSTHSSRPATRNGKPYCSASSSCFRKSRSAWPLMRPSSWRPSRLLIQVMACVIMHA